MARAQMLDISLVEKAKLAMEITKEKNETLHKFSRRFHVFPLNFPC